MHAQPHDLSLAPRCGIPLPACQHHGAAVPAFPPLQVMARRAVGLRACRAMSRAPFGGGNLFRVVAVRASDDLHAVAVGPGQGSAAAVLPAAALGTGGRKGHGHAFRCRAIREHTGRICRLPDRGRAQGTARVTGGPPVRSERALVSVLQSIRPCRPALSPVIQRGDSDQTSITVKCRSWWPRARAAAEIPAIIGGLGGVFLSGNQTLFRAGNRTGNTRTPDLDCR